MDSKNQYLIENKISDQSNNSQMNYQQQGVMYPPQQQQMNYPQQPQMSHPQQGGSTPLGIPVQPQQVAIQPPQQGGVYNPPQMDQHQGYPNNNQNITNNSNQSPFPVVVKCPQCQEVSTTVVSHKSGSGTYTMAALLCFIQCCCLPFCIDSFQDKVHKCPKCQFIVGVNEYKICK